MMKSFDPHPRIICLIPAYNEQDHITTVVSEAIKYLPVLVVDDGSHDQTAHLAEQAGARVLRQVPNQGKGAALIAGFRQCLAEGCEAVIMLDGDGQHDPAEIPLFLAAFEQKPSGLIIGQRDYKKMPFPRGYSNTLGRWMFSLAVGQYIPDNQSGYRLISRPFLEKLVENKESGFEFEVDMITQCLKHRMGLAWVPIRTIYAGQASHIRPLPHIVHFIRITIKAWLSMHTQARV